jgi:AcrR family transcriptional regulator
MTTNIESPSTPYSDTRQRILQAAARIFAEQGYTGATTRAIATAAGVNEVTLFRHFGDKKNLMMAVLAQDSALPGMEATLKGRLTGDYRQDLTLIGGHFLATMVEQRKAILMTLFEADHLPELREVISQVPQQQRQILGGYFRRQMERGVMRAMNPELAAQAFLGMFMAYSISQALLPEALTQIPSETVVAQFVDLFVEGTINKEKSS